MATLLTTVPVAGEPIAQFDRKFTDALSELQGLMTNTLRIKKNILPEFSRGMTVVSSFVTGGLIYAFAPANTSTPTLITNQNADSVFEINPAEFTNSGSTPIFSARSIVATNTIAPACNITLRIYKTLTYTFNNSNTADQIQTYDSANPVYTRVYTSPSASTVAVNTDDFTVSSQGYYVFSLSCDVTPAASSSTVVIMSLYVRIP